MRPESGSRRLLGITQAKAKMYEYHVPDAEHIDIPRDPARLFSLAIGLLGDLAVLSRTSADSTETIEQLREDLSFSARFFDSYFASRLNAELDPYLLLMGAATYYLCDLPGSTSVLVGRLGGVCPDIGGGGLENILTELLRGDERPVTDSDEHYYAGLAAELRSRLRTHDRAGDGEGLLQVADQMIAAAYVAALPRHILLADVSYAVLQRRIRNSVWGAVPLYSGISVESWQPAFAKPSFVKELWPAQHLLGQQGIYRGSDAVVQMPTSAGKTKATEIIIRSAFLSERTGLAVVVAPYRALCHEIRNSYAKAFAGESVAVRELSDVPQEDFGFDEIHESTTILVLTPEKLLYVLRHNPELAEDIGLLIYDEGHQFDAGARGVTYELLITSLKRMIPDGAQVVLISAVISNARSIAAWLSSDRCAVVSGTGLSPTYRTVGFASWRDRRGRLEFVQEDDPDEVEFFVPRVIEPHELTLRGRERKRRLFPDKSDSGSIAAYLGLKLVPEGSVAVFCGTRATASGLCAQIADAYSRDLALGRPREMADAQETDRLASLCSRHLGAEAEASQAARLGVFSHHGNTPQGLRLAVEYAMQKGQVRFVVCTSTLAQGVNLPIRYLIVRGLYQGRQRIRVRDFQNLIGRAGRSGMHTEGSILFAEPEIFERRGSRSGGWRWDQAKELLVPENSEPCASALLEVIEPLRSENRKRRIRDRLIVARAYVAGVEQITALAQRLHASFGDRGYSEQDLSEQIAKKEQTISAIESFLMAHGDDGEQDHDEETLSSLVEETLAFFLADNEERELLRELFQMLAAHVLQEIPEAARRITVGKTLLGVHESKQIERWVSDQRDALLEAEDEESLLSVIWPVLSAHIRNSTFVKCNIPEILQDIGRGWINGRPFCALLEALQEAGARIGGGQRPRHPKIDHAVDLCENALAYEGNLVLGAVIEMVMWIMPDESETLVPLLQRLQKRLKYGVASASAVAVHEAGFADRIVASEIASVLGNQVNSAREARRAIGRRNVAVRELLQTHPAFFMQRLEEIAARP